MNKLGNIPIRVYPDTSGGDITPIYPRDPYYGSGDDINYPIIPIRIPHIIVNGDTPIVTNTGGGTTTCSCLIGTPRVTNGVCTCDNGNTTAQTIQAPVIDSNGKNPIIYYTSVPANTPASGTNLLDTLQNNKGIVIGIVALIAFIAIKK